MTSTSNRTLQRQPTRYQVGTFIKTASPHIVEILGLTALDFAVIDAEHALRDRLPGRRVRAATHGLLSKPGTVCNAADYPMPASS